MQPELLNGALYEASRADFGFDSEVACKVCRVRSDVKYDISVNVFCSCFFKHIPPASDTRHVRQMIVELRIILGIVPLSFTSSRLASASGTAVGRVRRDGGGWKRRVRLAAPNHGKTNIVHHRNENCTVNSNRP